jgi:outer membrane protein assembly factor BamB
LKRIICFQILFVLIVSIFPFTTSTVKAEQQTTRFPWATYKHDLRRSGYTDSPAPQQPTLLWKSEIPEYYYISAPSVANGKVFIGRYALDQATGYLLWDAAVYDPRLVNVGSSPTVYGEEVYLTTFDGYLYCLSEESGAVIWSYKVGEGEQIYSSPAVTQDKVFVTTIFPDSGTGYLYAFTRGQVLFLWRIEVGECYSSPAISDGIIFVTSYQDVYAISEDGVIIWHSSIYPDVFAENTVTISDDNIILYSITKTVYCFNKKTGELKWQKMILTPTSYFGGGGVAVAYGNVYVATFDGEIIALDEQTGEEKWYIKINEGLSQPAIADGKIFVCSSKLRAIDVYTGDILWTYNYPDPEVIGSWSSPVIADGCIFVGFIGQKIDRPFTREVLCIGGVSVPDFQISISPGFSSEATLYVPIDSAYSHKAFYNFTITSLNGFSDLVSLDVSGLPYGITHSFYPSSLVPTMWSILELTSSVEAFLSIGFSTKKFTITITATGGGKTHSVEVSLIVSAPPVIPTLKTAVLVDPTTSKSSPIPEVITKISQYLKDKGYDVNYVRGTDVTVEWLRTGLKQGVIFWRGHGDSVLCTGELVDSATEAKYKEDFESGRIMKVAPGKTSAQYWAITSEFIRYYYKFNPFPYSLVFVEACNTLKVPSLAEAFTTRGAGAYIGYKGVINPTYPLWWWSADYQVEQAFYNFLYKGYSVGAVVNDLHRWYDPFCSLAWYGNWELKLVEYGIGIKSLGVSVHSPAHIIVIDPLGRQVGFDPVTTTIVNEIPEAIYTDPSLWADIEVVWIPQPMEGNYEIRLLGTNTGSFTLVVGLDTVTHVYTGTIISGQVLESTETISEGELISTAPSHTPTHAMANKYRMVEYVKAELHWAKFVVNESVIKSDVKESLLDKLTTSILKINQALDWIESDRDNVANNMLNAAKNIIIALNHEIQAQSDKSIPEHLANDWITVFQGIIQNIEIAKSLT